MEDIEMKQYLYRLWQWLYKGIPVLRVPANVNIMAPNYRLSGQKIIVTGGSQGIGYHIAKRLVAEDAKVLNCDDHNLREKPKPLHKHRLFFL